MSCSVEPEKSFIASGFARTNKMWLQMKAQTSGFARIHKVWLPMKAQTNIKSSSAAVYTSLDFYKRLS